MMIDRFLSQNKDAYEALGTAVVFDVDNIAEYLTNCPQYKMIDAVPNAAPMYQNMWFEHKVVSRLHGIDGLERVGVQVTATEYPHKESLDIIPPLFWEKYPLILNAKWLLYGTCFWEPAGRGSIRHVGCYSILPVKDDGKISMNLTNDHVASITLSPPGTIDHLVSLAFSSFWLVPLMAISFAHCKNTSVLSLEPSLKLQHARERRGHLPLVTYHTLEIKPMVRILREEGQSEIIGIKRALHICRGHFKDFANKGLFGKYKGLYWWDSQVRGSATSGVSLKDYKVSPN